MTIKSGITPAMLESMENNFESDPHLRALELMMSRSTLSDAAYDARKGAEQTFEFSVEVETTGITDQQKSGRCWLFASMNLMREQVIQKCKLEEFELSGNWLGFWDKFEKVNFFLECAIATAAEPLDSRTVNFLMSNGIGDGGQWDMMVSLINKYGIVPKVAMPESAQSCNTDELMELLNTGLRRDALKLRTIANEGGDTEAAKAEMLQRAYNALVICFGMPPHSFDFAYTDKDKVYHVDRGMTGKSFFKKYIGLDLDAFVSVINAPTEDKPFGKTYTVRYLGNVAEGRVRYLNVEMETLKAMAVRQLQDGVPVWFGSDCGKYSDRKNGIWDTAAMDYTTVLGGMEFTMSKAELLDTADSIPNHAMLICGVNLDEQGRPTRWKIENSWGEKSGKKGYHVASDAWFDRYVYQAVLNKKYLSPAHTAALDEQPIVLEPWDPMGTLA